MTRRDLIVIGASAGGVEALLEIFHDLPPELPAAVLVVLHTRPHRTSILPELLDRRCALPVAHAVHGEPIRPGRVYVAPPDFHLLVQKNRVHLARTATEHYSRPAIDPTFRTAAHAYGSRVVGVLLTGMLRDGGMGLLTIKRYGGMAIVQNPDDALYPAMPRHAVDNVPVDHVLPLSQIAAALIQVAGEPAPPAEAATMMDSDAEDKDQILRAERIVEREQQAQINNQRVGMPAIFTCPECSGTLWQADETMIQFRCHVGHLYAAEDLLAHQADAAEGRLWEVLRYLVDQSILARQLGTKAKRDGRSRSAEHFTHRAEAAEKHAGVIRALIQGSGEGDPLDQLPDPSAGGREQ